MKTDSVAETVGQRLKRLREKQALSQRDLARPGVSSAYVSRIEDGSRQPSVKVLRKLADALGVSVEYLETGEEIPLRILESFTLEELIQAVRKKLRRGETLTIKGGG